MDDMNLCGMNFDQEGTLISPDLLREKRLNRGECVTCGQVCYKKSGYFMKPKPLTIKDRVENGRCLVCNPIERPNIDFQKAVEASQVGVKFVNKVGNRMREIQAQQAQHHYVNVNSTTSTERYHPTPPTLHAVDSHSYHNRSFAKRRSSGSLHSTTSIQSSSQGSSSHLSYKNNPMESSDLQRKPSAQRSFPLDQQKSTRSQIRFAIDNEYITDGAKDPPQHHTNEFEEDLKIAARQDVNIAPEHELPQIDRRQQMRHISLSKMNSDLDSKMSSRDLDIHKSIRKISTTTSVHDVIAEMRQNPDVLDVQRESCRAFGALSLTEEERITVAEEGGLQLVIDAMKSHPTDEEVQDNSCRALWNLSASEKNQKVIASSGGIEAIIAAMTEFQKVASMQEKAIAALSNLGAIEENQVDILEKGGIKAIVQAMNKNLEDIDVQEKGCAAITNLSSRSKEIKNGIAKEDGINAIVVAMMFHECDPDLQEKALRALRNMCANDDDIKKLVAQCGGISYVICAMQNHREDAGVQEQGCWTLSNLAVNADNKLFIGENGGIDCIVLAMFTHIDKASLQEWACKALMSLSVDFKNKVTVMQKGGIGAVVNAMRSHQTNPAVQEKGCGVFANLAANSDQNKERIVSEEGLDAIVMAMALHKDNKFVQDRACSALRKLAHGVNIELMKALEVPYLLQHAKENFPEQLGDRIDHLLRVIESGPNC